LKLEGDLEYEDTRFGWMQAVEETEEERNVREE